MKLKIDWIALFASVAFVALAVSGQTLSAPTQIQTDIATAQSLLSKIATEAAVPPPDSDVVTLLKTAPDAYALLVSCAHTQGCQFLAAITTCAKPLGWAPAKLYEFGNYVSDPGGNIYQLTAISPSAASSTSSATAPAWAGQTTIIDGPLTWTLVAGSGAPGFVWTCGAGR